MWDIRAAVCICMLLGSLSRSGVFMGVIGYGKGGAFTVPFQILSIITLCNKEKRKINTVGMNLWRSQICRSHQWSIQEQWHLQAHSLVK